MAEPRECLACGEIFQPCCKEQTTCPPSAEDRAQGRSYSKCRTKFKNALQRRTKIVVGKVGESFDCTHCGRRCHPGQNTAPNAQLYCDVSCRDAAQLRRQQTSVWKARQAQQARRRTRRRKAERTLRIAAAGRQGSCVWIEGTCANRTCTERFVRRRYGDRPSLGCCSARCQRAVVRRAAGPGRKSRHRARRHGVAYEWINVRKVFVRDGYRCGLCGAMTDHTAQVPSPRAPTLDHVVPMSKGGPHLYSNVQCACFECNWRKSDEMPTAA